MAATPSGAGAVHAPGEVQVRRALLTVSDKRGLVDFARGLRDLGIEIVSIDLVCVNLYPFERTAAQRGVSDEEVIEDIDIGGPTLIRAAAKNHAFSAVVVRPESYDAVLDELRESDCRLSEQTR